MATERLRRLLASDTKLFNPAYHGLQKNPKFGEPYNVKLFTTFENRRECYDKDVHNQLVAGISGSTKEGAYSICVSGGYEDDLDEGDRIVYTGAGGQLDTYSGGSGMQTFDQSFDHKDNAALLKSSETGRPVRVVRGANNDSIFAPAQGYRYDGLYVVTEAKLNKGKSGHAICQFVLERCSGQAPIPKKKRIVTSVRI